MYPDYSNDVSSSNGLYLGKLHDKCATEDACNAARKVGRCLYARIDEVAENKLTPNLLVNNEIIKTSTEFC